MSYLQSGNPAEVESGCPGESPSHSDKGIGKRRRKKKKELIEVVTEKVEEKGSAHEDRPRLRKGEKLGSMLVTEKNEREKDPTQGRNLTLTLPKE